MPNMISPYYHAKLSALATDGAKRGECEDQDIRAAEALKPESKELYFRHNQHRRKWQHSLYICLSSGNVLNSNCTINLVFKIAAQIV